MSTLVSSADQVATNVRRYAAQAEKLADLIPYARAWYAIPDPKSVWLFGASKFVGYVDMTVHAYLGAHYSTKQRGRVLRNSSATLDGRVTEGVLGRWSEAIEEGHPLYGELHQALNRFAAAHGKKPNSLARISILQLEGRTAASIEYTDDLVALMVAVFHNLTPAQKASFRKKTG